MRPIILIKQYTFVSYEEHYLIVLGNTPLIARECCVNLVSVNAVLTDSSPDHSIKAIALRIAVRFVVLHRDE